MSLVWDINFPDNSYFIIPCGLLFCWKWKNQFVRFLKKIANWGEPFSHFIFSFHFFVRLFIFDCGTVIFTLSADLISHRTLIILYVFVIVFIMCKNIMWFLINLKKLVHVQGLTLPVHYNKIFFNNVKYVWYILFHHPPPMIVPL